MESYPPAAADLEEALERQLTLMQEFETEEQTLRDHLEARDWPALEGRLRRLNELSEALGAADTVRHGSWERLQQALGHRGDFHRVVSHLPPEPRHRLLALRCHLKLRAVGLKGLTQGLDTYVQTTQSLVKSALAADRPSLKGTLYGPAGKARPLASSPLVLNRHF